MTAPRTNKRKAGLSVQGLATLRLNQLARVGAALQAHGEVLPTEPWLRVVCNILSAVPPRDANAARKGRHPPNEYLVYAPWCVRHHARLAGVDCTDTDIARAIGSCNRYRRERAEAGKPSKLMMGADAIGKALGITSAIRREAEAWNIGTINGTPQARAEARKKRDIGRKAKARREAGQMKRHEYEANSLSRAKPWEAEGVDRATWYRHRAKAKSELRQVRPQNERDKSGATITDPCDKSGATIIQVGNCGGSAFGLSPFQSKTSISKAETVTDPGETATDDQQLGCGKVAGPGEDADGSGASAHDQDRLAAAEPQVASPSLSTTASGRPSEPVSSNHPARDRGAAAAPPAAGEPDDCPYLSRVERTDEDARLDWWNAPVAGWADGYVEIHNMARDETVRVTLGAAKAARKIAEAA